MKANVPEPQPIILSEVDEMDVYSMFCGIYADLFDALLFHDIHKDREEARERSEKLKKAIHNIFKEQQKSDTPEECHVCGTEVAGPDKYDDFGNGVICEECYESKWR